MNCVIPAAVVAGIDSCPVVQQYAHHNFVAVRDGVVESRPASAVGGVATVAVYRVQVEAETGEMQDE